jgi:hypothetical protein
VEVRDDGWAASSRALAVGGGVGLLLRGLGCEVDIVEGVRAGDDDDVGR